MTMYDVMKQWLKEHGYDGLFSNEGECACLLHDLAPCTGDISECEPGYKVKCRGDCHLAGEHGTFHVVRDKPGQVYGFDVNALVRAARNAKKYMQQAGLSHEELSAALVPFKNRQV